MTQNAFMPVPFPLVSKSANSEFVWQSSDADGTKDAGEVAEHNCESELKTMGVKVSIFKQGYNGSGQQVLVRFERDSLEVNMQVFWPDLYELNMEVAAMSDN